MPLALLIRARKHKAYAAETFKDCPDCPEMVVVPAGSFMMGSPSSEPGRERDEGPQHRVSISKPFAVGKYEVTQAEWKSVMGSIFSYFSGDRNPVELVSWDEVEKFIKKLSAKSGKKYRLLSEAEWVYAARAGTTTPFYTGNKIRKSHANFGGESTIAVGSFSPNAFGLHDMLGNVQEWVGDCWNGDYNGAPTNGSVWGSGDCERRSLRGGSWNDIPMQLRSAFRYSFNPGAHSYLYGFRVARDLE
jgi:formylglycine-generating enzyme required for sulfatase activity